MEIFVTGNEKPLPDGRVPFGSCMFGSRHGDYETYEVLLSSSAAKHVSPGDTLKWWRGASEWCHVDCFGEIIKAKDGSRIQLRGGMDIGIDTGHPPHLTLKYKEVWKPQWVRRDYDAKWKIIRHDESGRIWFEPKHLAGYGDLSPDDLKDATPLDYEMLPPLNEGERYGEHYYLNCYGWSSGWVEIQVRRVVKTKTDELLIVQPA